MTKYKVKKHMFVYKDKISDSSNSCKWKRNRKRGKKRYLYAQKLKLYDIDTLAFSWGKEPTKSEYDTVTYRIVKLTDACVLLWDHSEWMRFLVMEGSHMISDELFEGWKFIFHYWSR